MILAIAFMVMTDITSIMTTIAIQSFQLQKS